MRTLHKSLLTAFSLSASLGFFPMAQAAYTATTGLTATDMANVLLASSSGITINSASYNGATSASGSFSSGSFFGIDQGLVLTSGNASSVGDTNNGLGGSTLLNPLTTSNTFDASTLTINFVPTGSQIGFSYVFSSREYPNFVDSTFNDVFGFFVNSVNYALIPGTSTPVAINNINCGNTLTTGPYCNIFNDNRNGNLSTGETNFDQGGWTNVFAFTAPVTAGVVNTLVLAIADTGDGNLDSAAFIKGGSLQVCGVPGTPDCGGGTVPEPASVALMGLGLAALVGLRRRQLGK